MLFTDPLFLFVFLPVACALFYGLSRLWGATAGLAVIFAASMVFYLPWGAFSTGLLITSVVVNFFISQGLLNLPDERRRLRLTLVWGGEGYNLITLIWFKYHILRAFVLRGGGIEAADLIIPAGISFYTFHQAAFLADAYRRDESVVRYLGGLKTLGDRAAGFVRYAAFVTFFPQLVIGPITYLKEFQPQVATQGFGRFRQSDIAVGLTLMTIGMFKKLVLADNLAPYADTVFSHAGDGLAIHPVSGWIGVFAYYAQLYFDFSGYSDMALGLARMFGLRYPINFFSPLKSVGVVDFYRRWHMTLTRVISRFLYTPLSLNGTRFAMKRRWPKGPTRMLALWIPLLVNFEVIGLWHGALWTFVTFGLVHGAWYILETEARNTKAWKRWKKQSPDWLRTFLGRCIFLIPMALCFALFRSESLGAMGHLLKSLFAFDFSIPGAVPFYKAVAMLMGAFAVIYFMPNSVELLRRWRPGLATYDNPSHAVRWLFPAWRPTWPWALFVGVLFVWGLYYVSRQPPFLYQGF